jgi:hypothetical protein
MKVLSILFLSAHHRLLKLLIVSLQHINILPLLLILGLQTHLILLFPLY